jgi:DNA-binding transcriptional LysR family regulator
VLVAIVEVRSSAHPFSMSRATPRAAPSTPTPDAPSWELYETLLAVVDEGSFSGAARRLRVAQPTVRRRIEALEETLGVVLFTRAPNGLTPTDAATVCRSYAQTMDATAGALVRAVSDAPDGPLRGTVRISTSQMMGTHVMPSLLGALRARHPALVVELSLTDRQEDLVRRDADVAVRMTRPTQGALVARRVGTIPLALVASDAYLARHGAPKKLAQLADGHVLVGGDRRLGLRDALRALGVEVPARAFAVRCDDDVAQLALVRAGLGIGVCQRPLVSRWPDLRVVLPRVTVPLEAWVVTHEDLRAVRRVREVFDALVEGLSDYVGGAS